MIKSAIYSNIHNSRLLKFNRSYLRRLISLPFWAIIRSERNPHKAASRVSLGLCKKSALPIKLHPRQLLSCERERVNKTTQENTMVAKGGEKGQHHRHYYSVHINFAASYRMEIKGIFSVESLKMQIVLIKILDGKWRRNGNLPRKIIYRMMCHLRQNLLSRAFVIAAIHILGLWKNFQSNPPIHVSCDIEFHEKCC